MIKMNYVTKIRIIYTGEDEILKEYVKCFFEFIGVMVCEYRINFGTDIFKIPYDTSVINIALNDVSNVNSSKIKLREQILEDVINKIFRDDYFTCQTLQQIRSLYVSSTENKDLYLCFFTKDICCKTNEVVQRQKAKDNDEFYMGEKYNPIDVPLNAYIIKVFNELINAYVKLAKLKEIFSCPYKEFAMLNIQKHLNEFLQIFINNGYHTSVLSRHFDTTKIINSSILIEQVKQFLQRYSSFIGAYYLAIEVYYNNRIDPTKLCEKLKMEGAKRQERKFYAKAIKYQTLIQERNDINSSRIIPEYKKVYELEPLNFNERYKVAYITARDGRLKDAESILDIRLMDMYAKYNNPLFLIGLLQLFDLSFRISLLSIHEYSARGRAAGLFNICSKIDSLNFFLSLFDSEEIKDMYSSVINPCATTFFKEIKPSVDCTSLEGQKKAIESRIFQSHSIPNKTKSIGTMY